MADIQQFFSDILPKKLADSPELAADIDGGYQFDIEGAGQWFVDLAGEQPRIGQGTMAEPACVVSCAQADFEALLDNPSSALMLFTMGRLAVSDVELAVPLQQLLE